MSSFNNNVYHLRKKVCFNRTHTRASRDFHDSDVTAAPPPDISPARPPPAPACLCPPCRHPAAREWPLRTPVRGHSRGRACLGMPRSRLALCGSREIGRLATPSTLALASGYPFARYSRLNLLQLPPPCPNPLSP